MKEYTRNTINDVISKINRNIFLPDIQRPFVWKVDQIYKLFDSLMREYPISTLLFWELKKESLDKIETENQTEIKLYKFVDSNEAASLEEINRDRDEYSLVLDGQQRLTSLYIALKGHWSETSGRRKCQKELYFNVISGVNEDEDGILYEFEFKDRDCGISFIEQNGEGETIDKVWVNVKKVYERELGESRQRRQFVKELAKYDLGDDLSNIIDDNLDRFDDVLKKNGVINYFPENETDYERVLDIFVRTNSGGTKLEYSDLLFSKIKLKWTDAREEFKELIDRISINNLEFDNDFILKSCLLAYAEKSQDVRYMSSNLGEEFISKIKGNWASKIISAFGVSVDLLKNFYITDKKLLTSYNAVIPIIYWNLKKGKKYNERDDLEERRLIRVWLVKALLSGVFGGHTDTVLYKCKEAIDASTSALFPAQEIQKNIETMKNRRMEIDENKIDKFSYGKKESHLFLSICYQNAINFQPSFIGNLPEQDHIFSKKELKGAGYADDKINSIYNIRYVGLTDNRSKKDMPYADWVCELGPNKSSVFKKHIIPESKEYSVDIFNEFLDDRKALMLPCLSF